MTTLVKKINGILYGFFDSLVSVFPEYDPVIRRKQWMHEINNGLCMTVYDIEEVKIKNVEEVEEGESDGDVKDVQVNPTSSKNKNKKKEKRKQLKKQKEVEKEEQFQKEKKRLELAVVRYGPSFKQHRDIIKAANVKGLVELKEGFPLFQDVCMSELYSLMGEEKDVDAKMMTWLDNLRNTFNMLDSCGSNGEGMEKIATSVVKNMHDKGVLTKGANITDIMDHIYEEVMEGNLLDQVKDLVNTNDSEPDSKDLFRVMDSMDLNPKEFFDEKQLEELKQDINNENDDKDENDENEEEEEEEGEFKKESRQERKLREKMEKKQKRIDKEKEEERKKREKAEEGIEKPPKDEKEKIIDAMLTEEKMSKLFEKAMTKIFDSNMCKGMKSKEEFNKVLSRKAREKMIQKTMEIMRSKLRNSDLDELKSKLASQTCKTTQSTATCTTPNTTTRKD
jgi:hypothetical protein